MHTISTTNLSPVLRSIFGEFADIGRTLDAIEVCVYRARSLQSLIHRYQVMDGPRRNANADALYEVDLRLASSKLSVSVAVDPSNPDLPSSDVIVSINARLIDLQRQRNRCVPVGRLKYDVLLEMFRFVAHPSEGITPDGRCAAARNHAPSLLVCSQVSSDWRTIISTNSSLWTYPDLRYPQLAKHTIQGYSLHQPLHLYIDEKVAASSCVTYFKRAATLDLAIPPHRSQGGVRAALHKTLPHLEVLCAPQVTQLPTITTERYPKLHTIDTLFSALSFNGRSIIHSGLTTLTLSGNRSLWGGLTRVLGVLAGTPALQYLTLRGYGGISDQPVDIQIHLPQLRRLHVKDTAKFCRYLMTSLHFPPTVTTILDVRWSSTHLPPLDGGAVSSFVRVVQESFSRRTFHPSLVILGDRVDLFLGHDDCERQISIFLGRLPPAWYPENERVDYLQTLLGMDLPFRRMSMVGRYITVIEGCIPALVERLLRPELQVLSLVFPLTLDTDLILATIATGLIPYHDRLKETPSRKTLIVTSFGEPVHLPLSLADVLEVVTK